MSLANVIYGKPLRSEDVAGSLFSSYHGTIIRTEITCKEIPLQVSIEFGMALKQSATRYKQKTEIFLITRLPTCWKPDSWFWLRKGKKRIKANLQLDL